MHQELLRCFKFLQFLVSSWICIGESKRWMSQAYTPSPFLYLYYIFSIHTKTYLGISVLLSSVTLRESSGEMVRGKKKQKIESSCVQIRKQSGGQIKYN